jgi:hypothetical protein
MPPPRHHGRRGRATASVSLPGVAIRGTTNGPLTNFGKHSEKYASEDEIVASSYAVLAPANKKLFDSIILLSNLVLGVFVLAYGVSLHKFLQPYFYLRPSVDTETHLFEAPVATQLGTVSTVAIAAAAPLINVLVYYGYVRSPEFMSNQYKYKLNQYKWLHFSAAGAFLLFAVTSMAGINDVLLATSLIALWIAQQVLNYLLEMYLCFRPAFITATAENSDKPARDVPLAADEWFIYACTRIPIVYILITLLWTSSLVVQQDRLIPMFLFFGIYGAIGFYVIQEILLALYIVQVGPMAAYNNNNFVSSVFFTIATCWICVSFVTGTTIMADSA